MPVSAHEDGRFEWSNLTIACTECNRRKNDYYDEKHMFIDPYNDNVEMILFHAGPVVFHRPGEQLAEISIKILELNETEKRSELLSQKVTKLKAAMNLMDRIISVRNQHLKKLLVDDLIEMGDISSEYSAMIKSLIESTPGQWAN